jgi:hypothetical protein
MSLSKKIAAELDENTKVHLMPCTVALEEGTSRLTLHLTALDSVGVAFSSLEFVTSARSDWTPDALQAWGSRVVNRVTYLMEPLKVLETDAAGNEVQIRSQSPTARDDRRGYYQIRLDKSGSLRLERFAFEETTRRRHPVACQLTREVLERFADDLVGSVS